MTDLDTKRPEFSIGIRGYDRTQVDEYVAYLQRLVDDAQARARDAESEYMFEEHSAIGPRVAEIFALAEAEARDLRDRVNSQSSGLVEGARIEAQALLDDARREAAAIRERTEREHVVMFAELEQERERIRDEVAVLERCKAEAIGELNRLRELLGEAAGVVGEAVEIRGGAPEPARAIASGDETMELPAVTAELDDAP